MQIYLPIAEMSANIFLLLGMGGGVGFLSGLLAYIHGGFNQYYPPPLAHTARALNT